MPLETRFETRQIVSEHAVDEFLNTLASCAAGRPVGSRFERWHGIGDRYRAFARSQKRVVVLGVTNPDHVVQRQTKRTQRGRQASALGRAGGQHHDGALVEDDLQLQAELADDLQNCRLVWSLSRDNALAYRERHFVSAQPAEE